MSQNNEEFTLLYGLTLESKVTYVLETYCCTYIVRYLSAQDIIYPKNLAH